MRNKFKMMTVAITIFMMITALAGCGTSSKSVRENPLMAEILKYLFLRDGKPFMVQIRLTIMKKDMIPTL